jgi:CRP/FNR family transcriptional regulator, dissimilatory nitrate respiration regulator
MSCGHATPGGVIEGGSMYMHPAVITFLKAVPCFTDLSPVELARIAANCRPKSLSKGQLLFTEGEPCRGLYILESGRVKCYRASAEGREQVLKVFDRAGDIFCIPSAFSTGRHIVTAMSVDETGLYVIDREAVIRIAAEQTSIALSLVATAGEHMEALVTLAEDLSLKTATARLAKYLCEVAVAEGIRNGKDIRLHRKSVREERLASMLGTVRVHVSRSLKSLASAGAIRLNRRFVDIPDLTVLRRLAEGNCRSEPRQ